MFSLGLPTRSSAVVIITEASVCLSMNVISITGNLLVCLAVYKNPKLRSTTNLYIIALAATRSDLLTSAVFELLEGGFTATPCASFRVLLKRSLSTQLQQQWVYWR